MNTIESLRELYVKLGGEAGDVADLVTIPELIEKISSLDIGGGGDEKKYIHNATMSKRHTEGAKFIFEVIVNIIVVNDRAEPYISGPEIRDFLKANYPDGIAADGFAVVESAESKVHLIVGQASNIRLNIIDSEYELKYQDYPAGNFFVQDAVFEI